MFPLFSHLIAASGLRNNFQLCLILCPYLLLNIYFWQNVLTFLLCKLICSGQMLTSCLWWPNGYLDIHHLRLYRSSIISSYPARISGEFPGLLFVDMQCTYCGTTARITKLEFSPTCTYRYLNKQTQTVTLNSCSRNSHWRLINSHTPQQLYKALLPV